MIVLIYMLDDIKFQIKIDECALRKTHANLIKIVEIWEIWVKVANASGTKTASPSVRMSCDSRPLGSFVKFPNSQSCQEILMLEKLEKFTNVTIAQI
jgi:hypothetical protein